MSETRAQLNRKVRQDALREQLAAKGLVQHVIEIAEKLSNPAEELTQIEVTRLKAAADIQCKLINKYLPDTKALELSNDPDNPVTFSINNA